MTNSYDLKSAQEANARRMADDEAPAQYRGATPFPANAHRDCIRPPALESASEQYAKGLQGSYVYQGRQQAPSPDYSSPDVIHVEEGEQLGHWRQKCIEMGAELEKTRADLHNQSGELQTARIAVKRLQEQATDLATRLGQEHTENEQHRATLQAMADALDWRKPAKAPSEPRPQKFGVFFRGESGRGYDACALDYVTREAAQAAIEYRVHGLRVAHEDTYEVRPLS